MIVAKDLTEFELIKRARMKELQQKIDVRKRFERDYNHMIDTGVSLNLENYREPNELESFLNKQNVDANLQRLLVTDLGATLYTAKQFIQSLDITLKERLLERFPIFKKVFELNFTKATAITLEAAHSLLSSNILKNEQKMTLPDKNQVKDFVKRNITGQVALKRFREILDAKTGKESPSQSYSAAIDDLFSSMKFIDALTWLNSIMENKFSIPNLPLITIDTSSDIRSSMITEATPMEETPMEKIPKLKSRSKLPKAIKIKSRGESSKAAVSRFFQEQAGEQAEEQEV
jgi:hypothetical protein